MDAAQCFCWAVLVAALVHVQRHFNSPCRKTIPKPSPAPASQPVAMLEPSPIGHVQQRLLGPLNKKTSALPCASFTQPGC